MLSLYSNLSTICLILFAVYHYVFQEKNKEEYEKRLYQKEYEYIVVKQEMEVLREKHSESLHAKDAEYQNMMHTFTERILKLSGYKSDNEEIVKSSLQRFDKAIEVMEKQHTSLLGSQGHRITTMENEMRAKANQYDTEISQIQTKFMNLERMFTSVIQFIRYSTLQAEFVTSHRYILQSIQCDYPYLTFESAPVSPPAPALLALPPPAPVSPVDVPVAAPAPPVSPVDAPVAAPVAPLRKPIQMARPRVIPPK